MVSEEGPLLAHWVNRAAFQKSVGKIFYHAGFEDFQPCALDAVTDLAGAFMQRIGNSLKMYHEQPPEDNKASAYTFEEQVLHMLDENGMDIESLETWVRDDVDRQGTKLGVMHDRMKSHLADLLVSERGLCDPMTNTDPSLATCSGRSRWRRRCWCIQRRQRAIRRGRLCRRPGRRLLRLPRAWSCR